MQRPCSSCLRARRCRASSRRPQLRSKGSSVSSPGRSASALPGATSVSRSFPTGWIPRSAFSRCASSIRRSRLPSGASRSAAPSGARASSRPPRGLTIDFCIRESRRAPARGASGGGQRPGQRRAGQARRRQGGDAAPELPAQRTALRPGTLVDRPGGLAARKGRLGLGGSLMALSHRPTACAQAGIHESSECDHFRGSEGIQRKRSNAFLDSVNSRGKPQRSCWRR